MKIYYFNSTSITRKALYPLFFLTIFALCGCPYSSTYRLDNEPSNFSDDTYIGKWATMVNSESGKHEPVKMTLTKKSETEYDINFTGNVKDLRYYNVVREDTIRGTAFMSTVASRQFLNIQIKDQTYISEFVYKDDKISLLPLCEHFTLKIVKSNNELREALELHYKTRLFPLYDEAFCLKDMVRVN